MPDAKVTLVLKGGPKHNTTRQFAPSILQFDFPEYGSAGRFGRYSRPDTGTHYMEWDGWHDAHERI